MSTVTPTAATGTTTTTQSSSTLEHRRATSSLLGKDQFLQLMMAELKNQNPMSPNSSDPTQYVTELAQFTSLEQQTNTAQSTAQSAPPAGHRGAGADRPHGQLHRPRRATAAPASSEGRLHDSGPTLTVNGDTGIAPSGVTEVS